MAAIDFIRFHELAEQTRGRLTLRQICKREGVSYRKYSNWRRSMGIAMRRNDAKASVPAGMIEVSDEGAPGSLRHQPCAASVRIVFENGLSLERQQMSVDALIIFLTKIRGVLCLSEFFYNLYLK